MEYYTIDLVGNTLAINFAKDKSAQNDVIVKEVYDHLLAHPLPGGERLLITGPASLPISFVIAHAVAHLYTFVGVFDPKMNAYVVVVSHGGPAVGTLIIPA